MTATINVPRVKNTASSHPLFREIENETSSCVSRTMQAKVLREVLKRTFPGAKFSVRCPRGTSIRVQYEDGPAYDDVLSAVSRYSGGGFDGMTDCSYGISTWLSPDLSACVASANGQIITEDRPEGAIKVHFMGRFILVDRSLSEVCKARVIGRLEGRHGAPFVFNKRYGNNWGDWLFSQEARKADFTNPTPDEWD